jgi:hypothetical protein
MILILCLTPVSIIAFKVAVGAAWFLAAILLTALAVMIILINQLVRALIRAWPKTVAGPAAQWKRPAGSERSRRSARSFLENLLFRWLS